MSNFHEQKIPLYVQKNILRAQSNGKALNTAEAVPGNMQVQGQKSNASSNSGLEIQSSSSACQPGQELLTTKPDDTEISQAYSIPSTLSKERPTREVFRIYHL